MYYVIKWIRFWRGALFLTSLFVLCHSLATIVKPVQCSQSARLFQEVDDITVMTPQRKTQKKLLVMFLCFLLDWEEMSLSMNHDA